MVFSLFKKRQEMQADAPEGERLYAVGDIHGRADLLERLIRSIAADAKSFTGIRQRLIFLGDYVDRGLDSKGVIDLLLPLPQRLGMDVHYLRGNHEEELLHFLNDATMSAHWLEYGGIETLMSYGVNPPERKSDKAALRACGEAFNAAIPDAHRRFYEDLDFSLSFGDYFFCHAGVRPNVPLNEQDPHDLMWIRDEFLASDFEPGKVIVHGHTPTERPDVQSWRIGVDTGAYITGRLSCAVLEGNTRRFITTQRK